MTAPIAVVMGTFNGARYIEAQLLSVLNQTLLPQEIIISDDCSTDSTVDIIRSVLAREAQANPALRAIRVQILTHTSHIGMNSNYESALTSSHAELIALCDQDDIWDSCKLAVLAPLFEGRPDRMLVHSDAQLVAADGHPLGRTHFEYLRITTAELSAMNGDRAIDVLLKRNIISGTTSLLRRAVVNRALPIPGPWVPDAWLGIVASLMGEICTVEEPLVQYRQHSANTVGTSGKRYPFIRNMIHWARHSRGPEFDVRLAHLSFLRRYVERMPNSTKKQKGLRKIEFENYRASYPNSRVGRIVPIIRAVRAGNYHRFAGGSIDVICDLIQPA